MTATTLPAVSPERLNGKSTIAYVCHHHWMVEAAHGLISEGVCKLCGARKHFNNRIQDCLSVAESEYEEWLARQRRGEAARRVDGHVPAIVGRR